jgi:hypothetical protein
MEDGLEGGVKMTPEKSPPSIGKERPTENNLSFGRRELDKVLNEKEFNPSSLIGLFEKNFGSDYQSDAGVWEGYTIKQHTLMVMGQFEKYFGHSPLPAGVDRNLFRTMLALHDIGKPEAIRMGGKHLQHEYTEPKMNSILSQLDYSQQEKDLALAVATGDSIGNSLKSGDIKNSAEEIIQSAQRAKLPPEEFFDLLTVFYRADAGSYTEDAGGKRSLDDLFQFDRERKELRFAPHTNETIAKLKEKVLSLKETKPTQEKETWQMTRREFGNNFYLHPIHEHNPACLHENKSNEAVQAIRESGTITEGSFFLAINNDAIEKARESTEDVNRIGKFFIVSTDSLPSKKTKQPMETINIARKDKQTIPYIAEVPLNADPHRYLVYDALRSGKSVPQEVLDEYPYALLTNKSSPEDISTAVEKAPVKKEPWQTTRDEFGENYYLHGAPEPIAQLIRESGGIRKGAFINVSQDRDHTAIAYATDASNVEGKNYGKSGIGTTKGSIFIAHISDILNKEQRAEEIKKNLREELGSTLFFVRPRLDAIQEFEFRGRTIPYMAEIPPVEDSHRYLVEQALIEGKPVPEDVLIDYPEIGKTAKIKREIASIDKASRLSRFSGKISNALSRFTQRGK